MSAVRIFEDTNIRAKWNDDEDCWYFVMQDVIAFLAETKQPSKYWSALKARVLESENVELSTFCRQLKFEAKDGKTYKYECATNEGLFRVIQSIPSPKAEPFKRWLAKLGKERIEEIERPEKAVERATSYYKTKGRGEEWIDTRFRGISVPWSVAHRPLALPPITKPRNQLPQSERRWLPPSGSGRVLVGGK